MNFRKPIVNHYTDKPFHSSGYAQIANGGRIGSTDATSFTTRRNIENNRRNVSPYRRSIVGNARGVVKAKQYKPVDCVSAKSDKSADRQAFNAKQSLSYTEPQGRNYNPYS